MPATPGCACFYARPAAQVARESVLRFRPHAKIVAHHANVKQPQFDVAFFSQFAVVLNGLDNLDARRHVNRLCLAANVPLVESGTAGYLGQARVRGWRAAFFALPPNSHRRAQVSVHIRGETMCFECEAKPTPKTYPVCTIRNTPDKAREQPSRPAQARYRTSHVAGLVLRCMYPTSSYMSPTRRRAALPMRGSRFTA